MSKKRKLYLVILLVVALLVIGIVVFMSFKQTGTNDDASSFSEYGLATNTLETAIDLEKVLSGGPGKDGIPAINNPKFVEPDAVSANLDDGNRGVLFEDEGVSKFYPYNILVWHEIVNDEIKEKPIAVTFCPLCGSAIVYDRKVNNEVLTFGVSGLLYESNLLMYDQKTESLWSQIEGRAVVGDKLGEELEILSSQLLSFAEAKEAAKNPLQVLSENTGFNRDYSIYPYGDYDESEELFFPVTYKDQRLPAKEIMYATTYDNTPVAFVFERLKQDGEAQLELPSGKVITASYTDPKVKLTNPQGEELPGYFTQWFSWANHNLPKGVNPEADGVVWGIED